MTQPMNWATTISYMVRIFQRLVNIYHVTLKFDPSILNTCSDRLWEDQTPWIPNSGENKQLRPSYSDLNIENLRVNLQIAFNTGELQSLHDLCRSTTHPYIEFERNRTTSGGVTAI